MSKRLLIQLPFDSNRNKLPQYFPYPMLLLNIKEDGDELVDLNLSLRGEKELVKMQAIQKFIDSINVKEYSSIIVNMGESSHDADRSKYFEFWMDRAAFDYKIMGIYPTISRYKIIQKYPSAKIIPTDFYTDGVMIPIEMIKEYPIVKDKMKANLSITVGCPRTCKTCPVVPIHGKRYMTYNLDSAIEKILHYHYDGVRYITFTDDNISMNKKFFIHFLDRIIKERENKKLKGMRFFCAEGIEASVISDEEVCKRLVPAGFVDIKVMIENINPDFLKKINKQYLKPEMIESAIQNIKKYSLDARLILLIGLDETEEDILNNLKYVSKHKLPVRANVIRPYDGVDIQPTKVSEKVLENYRSLTQAIGWLGGELGIDLFEKDSLEQLIKNQNLKHSTVGEMHVIEGKLNLGSITVGRCIRSIQYMLNERFNKEYKVINQDAQMMTLVPKIEEKKVKTLF